MADETGHFTELSLGYSFENGITISGGWRRIEESGITTETLGVLAGFDFKI